MRKIFLFLTYLIAYSLQSYAQDPSGNPNVNQSYQVGGQGFDYFKPQEYIIGGVDVTGSKYLDKDILITLSQLTVGSKITIPGQKTAEAIENLWKQDFFDDVRIDVDRVQGDSVFLNIHISERPRLSKLEFRGLTKSQVTDIREKLKDKTGKIVNENLYNTSDQIIKKYLNEKGYYFAEIEYESVKDTTDVNSAVVYANVKKHHKVKVKEITLDGLKDFKENTVKKYLKNPKQMVWWRFWGPGKFKIEKYKENKLEMISKMQNKGYRDARILKDSIYKTGPNTIGINMKLNEGKKYYFGDITWSGNARYTNDVLSKVLGIDKGDVYSDERLSKRLGNNGGSPNGDDVSALYLDYGYLTFGVDPVQTVIKNDTVNLEMRIKEGPLYTINKVNVAGNDITNDRVVRRSIRTLPGQKFSKSDIVRTIQELGQLGYFDQNVGINPVPNPADGTVDLDYTVTEKPSDQVQLSGGFGGGRVIGTLGLTFNNFSLKNVLNLKEYRPLPKGDGQKLSISGQTNGKYYQSYSFSFSEPWLGGKKPIYFGVSLFTTLINQGFYSANYNPYDFSTSNQNSIYNDPRASKIRVNGATVTLGHILKWPDDRFQLTHTLGIQQYRLQNYTGFLFDNGVSNDFSLTEQLNRNSLDDPIFPTSGSNFRLTLQATPPYSMMNNVNYAIATPQERYKFTEYYKAKFESQWYAKLVGKLVFKGQVQLGFLGSYNKTVGDSPFGRFRVGGSGMQAFNFLQGIEIVSMRGYADGAVIPSGANPNIARNSGSPIFGKYIMELRYPVANTQQAKVYLIGFAEAGNTWNNYKDFNPFNVLRSTGVGARIYLPIFGMLGIDYGHGFDNIPGLTPDQSKQSFQFSIIQQLNGF